MTDEIPSASDAPADSIEGTETKAAVTEAAPAKRRTIRDHLEAADVSHQKQEAGRASGEARRENAAHKAVSGPPGDTKTVAPAAGTNTQTEQPQDGAIFSPHHHWPAARKELFAKQPPEVQKEWLAQDKEFEAGFTKKSQELSSKARLADSVSSLFTDEHRNDMRRGGIQDEAGAVKYLLAQHNALKRDPVKFVAQIMQNARIDPRIFLQGQQSGAPQQQETAQPAVHPGLMQELGHLRETVSHLTAREQERITQQVDSTIDAFENAKGDDGQLVHPHFGRVGNAMIEIVRNDPRVRNMRDGPEKLQKAYDLAVWGDETLRNEIIDAEHQRRVSTAPAPAQQPHRAPTSIKPAAGAPEASRGTGKRRSIRDHLAETDRRLGRN